MDGPYRDCVVLDGCGTAPSVGASPTAIGTVGCGGLDGRDATAGGVRPCGGRRGGTGVVVVRELSFTGASAGCPPEAAPTFGVGVSGTIMLIAGID